VGAPANTILFSSSSQTTTKRAVGIWFLLLPQDFWFSCPALPCRRQASGGSGANFLSSQRRNWLVAFGF